ncbi:MAG: hypothetical protein HYS33_00235 [Acidobacteria bacterium]|nr:hypothetical protein [Acidobacteriota bacterium]
MKYVNLQTGLKIDLSRLTNTEMEFYREAVEKFQSNLSWLAFDELAFGMRSPIYRGRNSHREVLKNPLFLALKDMSLQLGVQQGVIARTVSKEKQERAYA